MNELFGLGILLNAKDQASSTILRVSSAINTLTDSLKKSGDTSEAEMKRINDGLNTARNIASTGMGMVSLGSEFTSLGTSILSPFQALGEQVVSTSSQFENWRMTLKALYKDADVANDKLAWGLDLASKTPFEVTDVTEALVGFKAVGAEADTMFNNANGEARSFLEYMGDLASLRPDVGLSGVLIGVRNLLGGDGGKALRTRMDIDLEQILGRDFGTTTEEIMQDLVEVSDQLAGGLMTELEGTWGQLTSNLEDQATKMFLAIGDGGAFDSIKSALQYVSDIINKIDDDKFAKIGKNIASALDIIIKPLAFVVEHVANFVGVLIDLIASYPIISKLIVGFTSFVAVALIVVGAILSIGGVILVAKGAILALNLVLPMIKMTLLSFGSTLSLVLPKIALFGIALAVLGKLWKSDFGGIRTGLTNFAKDIYHAFTDSTKYANMGVADMMKSLDKLDKKTIGGWLTYKLTEIKVLWKGLCDAWNDYELSDENFQKLSELGLLPIIEKILDLKMKAEAFFKGFKEGWDNISAVVKEVGGFIIGVLEDMFTTLFPIEDSVKNVVGISEKADFSAWETFGETLSYIVGFLGGIWVISKIVGIITTIGSALSWIGSAFLSIWGIGGKVFGLFSKVFKLLWGGVGLLGEIVIGILAFFGVIVTLPAWLVGLITLAVVAIVALIITHWDKVRVILGGIVEFILLTLASLVAGAIGMIMGIVTLIATVVGMIITVIGTLVGVVMTIAIAISGIIASIGLIIYGVVVSIITAIVSIIRTIVTVVQTVIEFIKGFFMTGFEFIKAVVETFIAIIVAIFTGDFSGLAEKLKEIWGNFGARVKEIWRGVLDNVKELWNNLKEKLSASFDSLKEKWSGIMGVIGEVATTCVEVIKSVWGGITGFFSNIWTGIMDGASGMFTWLGDKFSWVTSAIGKIGDFFSGGGDSKLNKIKEGSTSADTKSGGGNMVGLSTGGYVKTTGIAVLHPNEVVVNDSITQQLKSFLDYQHSTAMQGLPQVSNPQPVVVNNIVMATPQSNDQTQNVTPNSLVSNVSTTTNANKSTTEEHVDNSVTFSEGAIQVTMTNGNADEIENLFKTLMKKIEREQQLRKTLSYK